MNVAYRTAGCCCTKAWGISRANGRVTFDLVSY